MARETKAERLAREAKARAAEEQALKASYPERLMAMLERATNQNYELQVRNGAFVLIDPDARSGPYDLLPYALSLESDSASEGTLRELDWRLEAKEEAEREARRRVEVRNAALSKLSAEEREVLGL